MHIGGGFWANSLKGGGAKLPVYGADGTSGSLKIRRFMGRILGQRSCRATSGRFCLWWSVTPFPGSNSLKPLDSKHLDGYNRYFGPVLGAKYLGRGTET